MRWLDDITNLMDTEEGRPKLQAGQRSSGPRLRHHHVGVCPPRRRPEQVLRGLHGARIRERDSPGNTQQESLRETQRVQGGVRGVLSRDLTRPNPTPGHAGTEGETGSQRERETQRWRRGLRRTDSVPVLSNCGAGEDS